MIQRTDTRIKEYKHIGPVMRPRGWNSNVLERPRRRILPSAQEFWPTCTIALGQKLLGLGQNSSHRALQYICIPPLGRITGPIYKNHRKARG